MLNLQYLEKRNNNVKHRQFWQHHNKPIQIWSLKVFEQKLSYIHCNPVISGFVTDPIDWKYSSAINYGNDDQTVLEMGTIAGKRHKRMTLTPARGIFFSIDTVSLYNS